MSPVLAFVLQLLVSVAIPPGQDALVGEMLTSTELPHGCRLAAALIGKAHIAARYDCQDGPARVDLRPHGTEGGTLRTLQFVLVPHGTVPPALVDALAARIRERESRWRWQVEDAPAGPDDETRHAHAGHSSPATTSAAPSAAIQLLAALGFASVGPWLLALALLLAALACWRRAPAAASAPTGWRRIAACPDALAALALGAGALALRLALGVFGPHHINGQGPMWIASTLGDSELVRAYGPGYAELFGPLARLAGASPDHAIFVANALFAALICPLAFALGRAAGLDLARAALAAALLAVDPVAIRFAATESYFPALLALTTGAAVAFAHAAGRHQQGERWRAALLAASGALLLAQAVRVHPVSGLAVALAPLTALLAAAPGWRTRLARTAAAYAMAALAILLTSGRWIAVAVGAGAAKEAPPTAPLASLSEFEHVLFGLVVIAFIKVARPRGLALLGAVQLGVLIGAREIYAQSSLWAATFDRLYIVLPVLAVVAAIPSALLTPAADAPAGGAKAIVPRLGRVVAIGAVLALFAWGLPVIRARTTEQLEYTWLRARFAALPPGCSVAHVPRAGRRVMSLPTYVVPGRARRGENSVDATLAENVAFVLADRGCVAYARTSLCSTPEGRKLCATTEGTLHAGAFTTTALPAHASYEGLPYDREQVEIGLALLQAR